MIKWVTDRRQVFLGLFAILLLWLAACSSAPAALTVSGNEQVALVEEVAQPTVEPPTATIKTAPPSTPRPPNTATPPSTATSSPTASATPADTPTLTPSPTPTAPPDRTCPEESPLKPEYNRYFLSVKRWPEPDTAVAEPHFWLSKPLPGGGRTLINQRFPYGWDENGRLLLHNAVDMAEDLGTPVLAAADGTVVVAQSDINAHYGWRCNWYGHLVVVELDEKWQDQPVYTLYGHILNIEVEVGQRVKRGDQLAEVGIGGAATAPHLHFEVRIGENEFGATRNPMLWLNPGDTRGVIAGRLVDPEGRRGRACLWRWLPRVKVAKTLQPGAIWVIPIIWPIPMKAGRRILFLPTSAPVIIR